jgi:hypothetical protein
MDAFTANDAVGRAMLAARVALIVLVWIALVSRDDRAGRALFATACGAFVASLAFRAAFASFALLAVVTFARAFPNAKMRERIAALVAVLAAGAIALAAMTKRPAPAPPDDLPGLTTYWLERQNLFEARFWAERWAAAERDRPGNAHFVLAEIDWELGHKEIARMIVADVAMHAQSDAVREKARHLLAKWGTP